MTDQRLAQQRLKSDAKNRSIRTFIQGVYVDLVVVVSMFVLSNIDNLDLSNREAVYTALASFGKTVLVALASYAVRRYGDKSRIPTGPMPPEDPGPPAQNVEPVPPNTAVESNDAEPADAGAEDGLNPTLLSHGPEVVKARAESQKVVPAPVKKAPAKRAPRKKAE